MGNPITETVSPETPAISAIATALRKGKTPCKPKKVGRREVVEREVVHDPAQLILLALKIAAICGRPDLRNEYSRVASEISKTVHISDSTEDDPADCI